MTEFLITFREALEASLIVWILYSFLTRQENKLLIKSLRYAVWASLAASIGVAFLFTRLESLVSMTAYEKLFEAILMFITAWILLKTIIWLAKWEYRVWTANHDIHAHADCLSCALHPQSQGLKKHNSKTIRQSLINAATHAIQSDTVHWGVFSLVFFAILREGFETVLLLNASQSMTGSFSMIGFRLWIVIAVTLWYAIVVRWKKVPIRRFFAVTSILLVVFAAGMVAYGVHETEEFLVKSWYIEQTQVSKVRNVLQPVASLEWITSPTLRSWNPTKEQYYHLFHDKGSVWVVAKWLTWYNSDPNWIEFILRLMTLGLGIYILQRYQFTNR